MARRWDEERRMYVNKAGLVDIRTNGFWKTVTCNGYDLNGRVVFSYWSSTKRLVFTERVAPDLLDTLVGVKQEAYKKYKRQTKLKRIKDGS